MKDLLKQALAVDGGKAGVRTRLVDGAETAGLCAGWVMISLEAALRSAARLISPGFAGGCLLMMVLVGGWVGGGYGRFRDLLEQCVPLLVEFAKGRLAIVQVRHDSQKEQVQVDRDFNRAEIDA